MLDDGRLLAWRWVGDVSAPPILWLHGSANTRMSVSASGVHARMLAVDRPGFGRSSRCPGRGLRSVADDMDYLLDHLGVERVAVIGVSAGGPHALAFAACHADRVASVGVVSGACPLTPAERSGVVATNRVAGVAATQGWAALHDVLDGLRRRLLVDGDLSVLSDAAPEDLERMEDRADEADSRRLRAEALRQGAAGWTDEALAIMTAWDFDLDDVTATVTWWHGELDRTVPVSAARRVANRLPHCELIVVPNRGHKLGVRRVVVDHLLSV